MAKYLTKEGIEKLKKELEYLENVKRKELSDKLKYSISQGDLSENAGYDAAKEEQGFVEGRIRELKEIINQAAIIEKNGNSIIQIGSIVSIESDNEKEVYQIVSPEEVDIMNNKISFKSPLGAQLLRKRKGEIVKIKIPNDGVKEYKIINVK